MTPTRRPVAAPAHEGRGGPRPGGGGRPASGGRTLTRDEAVWRNWAGNQQCAPTATVRPTREDELVEVVRAAATAGVAVKARGAGHSFTGVAVTDGWHVDLDGYGRLLTADPGTGLVTVEAGMRLHRLCEELAGRGLALENLGDVTYQTVAGAVATGTHGTGARVGALATQLRGLRLVTGDGSVLDCSPDVEPEVFAAARVGLGALGLVSTLTLQAVPAFRLHAVEEPAPVDAVIEAVDELVDGNEHFEFFWVPGTRWALTKRNNRTDAPVGGRSAWGRFRDEVLVENVAFGALARMGARRPSLIPRLAAALPSRGRVEYVDRAHRVFASPRLVRFYEMEYAVPRAALPEALSRLRAWVRGAGLHLAFPVEVRFVAADDIPLSPFHGRDSCTIAVHMARGRQFLQYFRAVERIMDDHDGRPHWGKLHEQTSATLRPRYPGWDRFQTVRARVDPDGRFANEELDRVLGPLPA